MAVIKGKYKPKYIKLSEAGKSFGEIGKFGDRLIEGLGDSIFHIQDMDKLLYLLLNQVYPVNKTLQLNSESINNACAKINTHFGFDKPARLSIITKSGPKEIIPEEKTPRQQFCEWIIRMDQLPADFYRLLQNDVNEDLASITELIRWYESHQCIVNYTNDDIIPKNHEERIILDFYKRCLKERGEIVNYHLNGLKKQALNKAGRTSGILANIFSFSDIFNDRPYYYARFFSIHYFDCREIDLSGHRVGDLPVVEGRRMQQLYSSDKEKFYKVYFKRINALQHFSEFKFYLPHLPLSNNRSLIFDELIKLFKAKRWMSFYALALPQVEGLFTEMCTVITEKDLSGKSLTQKVGLVRPFHSLSNSYFDYYQYHIPLQRNKFAHTGYEKDFRLRSYDILVDLLHLMKIFFELENPLVKVTKLHTRKNTDDFLSLAEFVDYFSLLGELKPKQRKDIKDDIIAFEKTFLTQDCDLEYLCYELMQNFPDLLDDFKNTYNAQLSAKGFPYTIETLSAADIHNWDIEGEDAQAFINYYHYHDNMKKLATYLQFLSGYKKFLPNILPQIKAMFDTISKENADIIQKMTKLFLLIKTA